jgi:hypothetical protein
MEQLNYNLLYRWFVGLSPDDPVYPVRLIGGPGQEDDITQRASPVCA